MARRRSSQPTVNAIDPTLLSSTGRRLECLCPPLPRPLLLKGRLGRGSPLLRPPLRRFHHPDVVPRARQPHCDPISADSFSQSTAALAKVHYSLILPTVCEKLGLDNGRWKAWWTFLRKIRRQYPDAENSAHLLSLYSTNPGIQVASTATAARFPDNSSPPASSASRTRSRHSSTSSLAARSRAKLGGPSAAR